MRAIPVVILLAAIAGFLYLYQNQECTVGYSGTAATVTIHGPDAAAACAKWRATSPDPTYDATTTPVNPVVCEVPYSGRRYIVRDQGAFKIYGSQICSRLSSP